MLHNETPMGTTRRVDSPNANTILHQAHSRVTLLSDRLMSGTNCEEFEK